MIKIVTRLKQDTNFLLLFLASLSLGIAVVNPSIPITRNIYNYIFIVDIRK